MLRARSTLEKFAPLEVAFRRGPAKTWSLFEIWQIYRPRSTGIRVNCEVSPPVPCCVDGYKLHSGVTLPSPTISWSSSPSLAVAAAADLVSLKRVSHKTWNDRFHSTDRHWPPSMLRCSFLAATIRALPQANCFFIDSFSQNESVSIRRLRVVRFVFDDACGLIVVFDGITSCCFYLGNRWSKLKLLESAGFQQCKSQSWTLYGRDKLLCVTQTLLVFNVLTK